MSSFSLIVSIGVFVIVVLLVLAFALPTETSLRRKKKRVKGGEPPTKDWQEAALKLEKHISSLREELEKIKNEQKNTLRELGIEKEKNKKLQDKIAQEREWLNKEKESMDKKVEEASQLKENLITLENEREGEYSLRLKVERDLKETQSSLEVLEKGKRELLSKLMQTEGDLDYYKKESEKQRKINLEISKKSEETNWIAKAEYEKLEKILKEKEKELERILRNQS